MRFSRREKAIVAKATRRRWQTGGSTRVGEQPTHV
jgi:hypothetical protein